VNLGQLHSAWISLSSMVAYCLGRFCLDYRRLWNLRGRKVRGCWRPHSLRLLRVVIGAAEGLQVIVWS